jgi:hypothetical protein
METNYNGYSNFITWKVAHELIDPYTFDELDQVTADDLHYQVLTEVSSYLNLSDDDQALRSVILELVGIGLSKINYQELAEVFTNKKQ